MSELGEAIRAAAASLPLWRDLAVAGLAAFTIGCLWLYVSLVDPRP